MTIFAKATMALAEWAKVQREIGTLQKLTDGSHDVMMFCRDSGTRGLEDIYIGLPSKQLLTSFPGFVEIAREELPENLSTLIIREDGFAKRCRPRPIGSRHITDCRAAEFFRSHIRGDGARKDAACQRVF